MTLEEDSSTLNELAEKSKSAKDYERLRVLYAVSIGKSVREIAEIFCIDEDTVYTWIKKWKEKRNVFDEPRSGRPPSFTEEEKKELKKLIDENDPGKHGMNASYWDTKELTRYFVKKGIDVSQETLRRTLHEMGAHYVKAEIHYSEADFGRQAEFARQFLSDVEEKPANVIILFGDEMGANRSPKKGYGSTFNKRLVVKAQQSQKEKTNCFGATDSINGDTIQMQSKSAKSDAFVRFLQKISAKYPDNIVWLYLDNGQVHKSVKVKKYLQNNPNITLKFLPPYSPDLNPQEQMWKHERRKFLNNRCFDSLHQLSLSLNWFVKRLGKDEVRSVCSLIPIEQMIVPQY